jgi:hypothetical protein
MAIAFSRSPVVGPGWGGEPLEGGSDVARLIDPAMLVADNGVAGARQRAPAGPPRARAPEPGDPDEDDVPRPLARFLGQRIESGGWTKAATHSR